MKFEVLKKSNLKRNIIIGVFAVLIISAIILNFSSARYRSTASVPVVDSTVNYTPYNFRIMEVYVNSNLEYTWNNNTSLDVYTSSTNITNYVSSMSDSIYTLDNTNSYCTTDNGNGEYIRNDSVTIGYSDLNLSINNNSGRKAKCYLYFDETPGITLASLTYNATTVNRTTSPNLIVDAEYESINYSITSGSTFASINSQTGIVTGRANGTAIVQASITDKSGNNIIATSPVQIGSVSNTNRYVWNRYRTVAKNVLNYNLGRWFYLTDDNGDDPVIGDIVYIKTSKTVDINTEDEIITLTGNISTSTYELRRASAIIWIPVEQGDYISVSLDGSISSSLMSNIFFYAEEDSMLYLSLGSNGICYLNSQPSGYDYSDKISLLLFGTEYVKGALNGTLSSLSSDTYPNDEISGAYWYTYQGSDIIDPNSVTLSISGSNVIATVNNRSNSYGGTISYNYEYSTDGGLSWTTAATTSNRTYNIPIPNAKSMIARVKAQDNYGFTSNTYIHSNGVSIIN